MNNDLGNKAADLRRIANWIARGQTEKLGLVSELLESMKKDPKIVKVLKHFHANIQPESVMADERERMFLAEQLLISSSRLVSMA